MDTNCQPANDNAIPKIFTVKSLAQYLQVNERTIHRMLADGLQHFRVGRGIRILVKFADGVPQLDTR